VTLRAVRATVAGTERANAVLVAAAHRRALELAGASPMRLVES